MKSLHRTGTIGLFVTLASAHPVAAQEAVVEGPGVQLGEGTVFHPSVALETGIVSNVFYEADDPVSAGLVRLIGAFSIASQTHQPEGEMEAGVEVEGEPVEEETPPQVDFRVGGQVILNGYVSDKETVRDQSDVGVGLDGNVTFFPKGDFALTLDDSFLRDTRPRNFESTGNLNRDYNHFTGGARFQPQGRTISVGARYENVIDRFESDEASFANRIHHIVAARGEWRLFPYTKFFLDASLGFFSQLEGGAAAYKPDSMPLRIQTGVGTALTEVTTLRAYIGYGNGFYDSGPNFSNVIGGAEFGWRYTEYGRLILTADYNFHDSLQANFYRDYSFLATLQQQLGLILGAIDGGVRLRGYRGIPAAIMGPSERDDVILFGTVRAAYLLRDWLAITARVEATVDSTDYMYTAGTAGMVSPEYTRVDAFIGVSAAF